MLATITKEEKYWAIYDKLWRYSWDKWVDHEHGSWSVSYTHLTLPTKA